MGSSGISLFSAGEFRFTYERIRILRNGNEGRARTFSSPSLLLEILWVDISDVA